MQRLYLVTIGRPDRASFDGQSIQRRHTNRAPHPPVRIRRIRAWPDDII